MYNTVLTVLELNVVNRELVPDEYKYKIIALFEVIAIDILKNMIMKLKKDNKDIYHYQSKVLNYSRDKVLSIITNLHEIMIEKGIITNMIANEDRTKEGTILCFSVLNPNKEVKIKINKFKTNEDDIKWVISYVPLTATFSDSLIEWVLLKLNDNQTLVTNTNKYLEQIDPIVFKNLTEKKIQIKELIEEEINKKYS